MNCAIIPAQHVVVKAVGLAAICSYKNNCEVQYMKILKSAVIAFSLAAAMGSFSTAAVAEAGRTSYKPLDNINMVLERITTAETAINNGAEDAEVAALIKKAADISEEINANDKVARDNSKVRQHLKAAISSAKAANLQESKEHLAKARAGTEALKKLL
jgi:hypothetical protein